MYWGPRAQGWRLWWLGCKGEHDGEILEVTRGSLVPYRGKVWLPAAVFPFPAPFSLIFLELSLMSCVLLIYLLRAVSRGHLPYWKRGALIPGTGDFFSRATHLAGDGSADMSHELCPQSRPFSLLQHKQCPQLATGLDCLGLSLWALRLSES